MDMLDTESREMRLKMSRWGMGMKSYAEYLKWVKCTTCKAKPGEVCKRVNGQTVPQGHQPRQDRAMRLRRKDQLAAPCPEDREDGVNYSVSIPELVPNAPK